MSRDHYEPTAHIRYVNRFVPAGLNTVREVQVLQQRWTPQHGGQAEWRDVQIVAEEEIKN